jgi:hypothetical protein
MNTRTSPQHAHQPEAWHQCWEEYNALNEQIRVLRNRLADTQGYVQQNAISQQISALRQRQRNAVARSENHFVAAPLQNAA